MSKLRFEWPLLKIELDVRIQDKLTVAPYRTIDWEPVHSYRELSISASVYSRSDSRRSWRDSMFGQCRGEVRERTAQLAEPQREAALELLAIWERWHLNGMNAGLRTQRDALQSKAKEDPAVLDYNAACKYLDSIGLLTTTKTKYTYGSAWLVDLLPEDVEQTVTTLCRMLGGHVSE